MSQNFAAIRAREAGDPEVSTSRMFGTECLKVKSKVYAMEFKGDLVVKLSKTRAATLVSEGRAQVFDPGHGRPMKQWIAVSPDGGLDWAELVEEAKSIVRRPA
jgi:TfoX/Sxy family transcriptional regulator of competence genes